MPSDSVDHENRELLLMITELYGVEDEARSLGIEGTPEHLELRQRKSARIVKNIWRWVDDRDGKHSPKSKMGAALSYAVKQRDHLSRFCTTPSSPSTTMPPNASCGSWLSEERTHSLPAVPSTRRTSPSSHHPVDHRDLPYACRQSLRLHPTHAHRDSVAPGGAHRRADALALAALRGIAAGTWLTLLRPSGGVRRALIFDTVASASAPRRQTPFEAVA